MKRMVIEIKDDDFHYRIKEKAFRERKSIKDYVVGLIENDLKKEVNDANSEN